MKTEEYQAMANLLNLASIAIEQTILRPQGVVPDEVYEFSKEITRTTSTGVSNGGICCPYAKP